MEAPGKPELQGKACGPARSLVRMIGTHLPLKPCTRAFIQTAGKDQDIEQLNASPEEDQDVPSLADIMWIMDDEGETFSRLRSELRPGKQNRRTNSLASLRKVFSSPCMRGRLAGAQPPLAEEDAPSHPRLEEELSHLRAQIALLLACKPTLQASPGAEDQSCSVPAGLAWVLGSEEHSDDEDETPNEHFGPLSNAQPYSGTALTDNGRHPADPASVITEAVKLKFSSPS